ncbi:hypothetical protein GCM10007989_20690 [Devosia pacifica]|uniref:Putative gamma-glutamylcyclotransferase n=1 Tax=Devosia pacifica TaxID=1335967 RepID=A0A918S547_9HYPH|nr:gamma-glutamylcyclotransferase family protein [Devosia pacifica]GHA24895.1 hypothetical protein GCM10007989_20690 [Devosia pacifica]
MYKLGQSLFVYGTLRDEDVRHAVLRGHQPMAIVDATIVDHVTVYFPMRAYPALVRKTGAHAPGVILFGLRAQDMLALDDFEGEEYRRTRVTVETAIASQHVWVYRPRRWIAPAAPRWSIEHWRRHHKQTELKREQALVARLRR